MTDIIKVLLKNGIRELASLNEDYFKENITHALEFKLNSAIDDVQNTCSKKLLESKVETENTPELNEFIQFVQNFKEGKYEFKNHTHLNITDSDMSAIKGLFEALGPENRQKMIREIFESNLNFKQHVDFYNNSKGLLK